MANASVKHGNETVKKIVDVELNVQLNSKLVSIKRKEL